ncbi:MAG TPA: glycosyltransferase family 2 protein [Gemmatales bacterium]|nr:glycosyltransferase family 2 protein [Gemmatales bacterium]
MLVLAIVCLILACIPAALFWVNLPLYRPAPSASEATEEMKGKPVSVLIPARNEELSIAGALQSVLVNEHPLEVIVLEDNSHDNTVRVVKEFQKQDERIRLELAPALPAGWSGKQHACAVLARHARHEYLLFQDADVRIAPEALIRLVACQHQTQADLLSGVPLQRVYTFYEQLALPLIHFLLLGFLPIRRMRQYPTAPAYGAGCGQLFFTTKAAYDQAGGHAAIRNSLHDGIKLPRAYRSAGFKTDLFDATDLAQCRMYTSAEEVWNGLAKNATEGLGNWKTILPATVLLLGGQVLPWIGILIILFVLGVANYPWFFALFLLAAGISYIPRVLGVPRFQQPILSALLHPLGVVYVLIIQWYALVRKILRVPSSWRGRTYE